MWSLSTLSTLPKFLPAGAVQRLLDHHERETPRGKRNYAVLLLLARLGLRACEIVALELDHIDWDHGRITIRGKGGRLAQMPLPSDVGKAIALYLRPGRPCCACRRVFLRHRAPIRGFAHSITVSPIMRRALIEAGIDSARKGAQVFRHTLATDFASATSFPRRDRRIAPSSNSKHNCPLCQSGLNGTAQLSPSLAGRWSMKTLREAVRDYLALRGGLGFKLKKHQRFLQEFASFLEQENTSQITSRLALRWATQPEHIQPAEWAARLCVVRGFARCWSATDATTEVPPDGLLPYRPQRAKPYLYSDEQIRQLLEAAKNMPATHSLCNRGRTTASSVF
jgi:site-specific recombinase XerD